MSKRKIKLHKSDIRPGPWGSTVTGTLCRRSRVMDDGMNIADKDSEVTCLLCLRAIEERDAKKKEAK